jgi:hypothetical protein
MELNEHRIISFLYGMIFMGVSVAIETLIWSFGNISVEMKIDHWSSCGAMLIISGLLWLLARINEPIKGEIPC